METLCPRVVIVEDDEIILEFLEMVFASETMEVIRAEDGRRGLEVAERHLPDVIVCDLHMAGLTGLDVLGRIRSHPTLSKIPVVILTADQNPALRNQCLECGADAFILKPFDPDHLIATLRRLAPGRPDRSGRQQPFAPVLRREAGYQPS